MLSSGVSFFKILFKDTQKKTQKKYQSYMSYLSVVVVINGGNPLPHKKHCHK